VRSPIIILPNSIICATPAPGFSPFLVSTCSYYFFYSVYRCFASCVQYCLCLRIVHSRLHLRFSLMCIRNIYTYLLYMTIPTTTTTITRTIITGITIAMVSEINKTNGVWNMYDTLSSVELWKERINKTHQYWENEYSGTCLIWHTKEPRKCVGLYRMSDYSDFILANRICWEHKFFVGCQRMSENRIYFSPKFVEHRVFLNR
jgi:hypothetical protein